MKRNTFGLAITIALVAYGCAPSDTSSTSGTKSGATPNAPGDKIIVGMVFDSGGRGDKSFNDSAYAGLEKAMSDLNVEPKPVESRQVSDYEKNLTALAQAKVPFIVAVGLGMKDSLQKVAAKFPDTKFALVDETVDLPNVRGLKFKEEEGSFLAGYLAALMSKTGKLGFVGGAEIPLIKKFEAGYIAGAKTANPAIIVLPAKYTGSWNDADLGKQTARTLYGQGADIIYHASGACGKGVFEAAKETNNFAIGVDSDQDYLVEGKILTSMVKRVDEAVYQSIKDYKEGNFSAGEKIYDLKSMGVGLSEMKYTRDMIGPEKIEKVGQAEKDIIDGKIKVPTSMEELKTYEAGLKK